MSPAAESIDKVMAGLEQPWTKYYFITAGGIKVGAIRVVDKKDGSRKRISPIWIMQDYRNKGYAQQAILEAEKIYGSDHWCLNTILQEKGNLHLYEKLGYHQTVGTGDGSPFHACMKRRTVPCSNRPVQPRPVPTPVPPTVRPCSALTGIA